MRPANALTAVTLTLAAGSEPSLLAGRGSRSLVEDEAATPCSVWLGMVRVMVLVRVPACARVPTLGKVTMPVAGS